MKHQNLIYSFGLVLFLFAGVCAPSFISAQPLDKGEPQFFTTLNDVPLMAGLTELPEDAVYFDKPEGRIAISRAISDDVTPADIQAFYNRTLPYLGWTAVGESEFTRQQEKLSYNLQNENGMAVIEVRIAPKE